jgi:hypothetical protein
LEVFVVNTRIKLLAIFYGVAIAPVSASAVVLEFEAVIDQSCASTGSPATGTGSFQLDTDTGVFSYEITFSGLTSPEIFSHIHQATVEPACPNPGGANPPIVSLPNGSPKIGSTVYSPAQQADLIAGLHYVNIHTNNFTGGEITGIITAVEAVPSGSVWSGTALVVLLCGIGFAIARRGRATA